MKNEIVESFVETMKGKGFVCTDPDTLQFAKKTSACKYSYVITQTDASKFSNFDGNNPLVKVKPVSENELMESLVEDSYHFSTDEEVLKAAEMVGVDDIEDYEDDIDSLAMVVSELAFEEEYLMACPDIN